MLGLVKRPNGETIYAHKYPESLVAARMIRINGGNRRRGLMAFAIHNAQLCNNIERLLNV